MRKVIDTSSFPESTPSQKAYLQILALSSKPELQHNHVFGGPMPPEMAAENARRTKEYQRQRLEIIAKYGVFDEYLTPLRDQEKHLSDSLAAVRQEITELEKLQQK